MITSENLVLHELIGLDTTIVQCSSRQLIGLRGKVVDETKSMFTLKTANGFKKFPKENTLWKFSVGNKDIILDGRRLSKRSYERLGGKQ